jgi:hypothetical protein
MKTFLLHKTKTCGGSSTILKFFDGKNWHATPTTGTNINNLYRALGQWKSIRDCGCVYELVEV